MSRWLARLEAKTSECAIEATDKTDRSRTDQQAGHLLAVLAVSPETHAQEVREASNDGVSEALPSEGNPHLSREASDRCHAPAWSDGEIFDFTRRAIRFAGIGLRHDADNLAEVLTLRDRDNDDRRLCVECRHGRSARCPDGLPMPLATLHRCGAFTKDTP